MEASTICSGVLKSGCPIPRLIIFFPSFFNFSAFPNITKAFSVPNLRKFGFIIISPNIFLFKSLTIYFKIIYNIKYYEK